MTDKKATPQQLRQVVAFVLNNIHSLTAEDAAKLTEAFALTTDSVPTPEPTPEPAPAPAIADTEGVGVWRDMATSDVCTVKRGTKQGFIELRFDGRPHKDTIAYLKTVKTTNGKQAFRYAWKDKDDPRWWGKSEYFNKLSRFECVR